MPTIVKHGTVLIGYTPEWAGWGTVAGAPPGEKKGEQDTITYHYGL